MLTDEDVRDALREGIDKAREVMPFRILAWVLLPDHLHCIWTLPEGDADFEKRWGMIKRHVSQRCGDRLSREEWLSESRRKRNETSLWQRLGSCFDMTKIKSRWRGGFTLTELDKWFH